MAYYGGGYQMTDTSGFERKRKEDQARIDAQAAQRNQSQTQMLSKLTQTADPFAGQRGTYQTQLAELMNNPSGAMENNPFFKASNEQGMEAASRRLAQSGMGNSGNAAIELQRTSQANMANQFIPMANLLGGFSGANQNPAAASQAALSGMSLINSQNENELDRSRSTPMFGYQRQDFNRGYANSSPVLSGYWGQ